MQQADVVADAQRQPGVVPGIDDNAGQGVYVQPQRSSTDGVLIVRLRGLVLCDLLTERR